MDNPRAPQHGFANRAAGFNRLDSTAIPSAYPLNIRWSPPARGLCPRAEKSRCQPTPRCMDNPRASQQGFANHVAGSTGSTRQPSHPLIRLISAGHPWTLSASRKIPKPEKCLKMATNPTYLLRALFAPFYYCTSLFNTVCSQFGIKTE